MRKMGTMGKRKPIKVGAVVVDVVALTNRAVITSVVVVVRAYIRVEVVGVDQA